LLILKIPGARFLIRQLSQSGLRFSVQASSSLPKMAGAQARDSEGDQGQNNQVVALYAYSGRDGAVSVELS